MASSLEFTEYVCEQIRNAGEITYKKMFGEYGIYCYGKIVALICDNQFFVKKTVAGANLLKNCKEAPPYKGAKPYFFIENLENEKELVELIKVTYEELPLPLPKKKKAKAVKA